MKSIKEDYKDILIAVLIMGILSMTIAYANFTRRLQIVNTAKVNATNWDIHFENLVLEDNSTTSMAVINSPASISEGKTIIGGLNVSLVKPGDYVTYTFDIVNAGDLDAKLYHYFHSVPVCKNNESVCEYVHYSLKYTNGNEIKVSDTLKVGERKNVKMTISLDNSLTNMPKQSVELSDLYAVFDYVQE